MIAVLVETRKAAGVTQVELGRRIGKPQSFVSEIETKERRLDVLEFYVIASALNSDPGHLLNDMLADVPLGVAI